METIKFNLDKYKASKKCFVKTKSGEDVRIAAILKNGDIVAYVGNDKEASLYESNGKLKGNEIELYDFDTNGSYFSIWRNDTKDLMLTLCDENIKKNVKELQRIRVRAYKLAEAEEIMHFAMHNGFEGVKNDSYRYCKESAEYCLNDDNCCYICVSIINHYGRGSIIVSNAHWGERKKFVEVSRSKFEEIVRKNRTI